MAPPRIIQIGFNRCGTRTLARWFGACGYRAAHWGKGRLARDVAAAEAAGRAPFAAWPDYVFFSDLEAVDYEAGAVIEAYKRFAFLDAACPDALFLLNTRRMEDWLFSRARHRAGRYIRCYAAHYGLHDPRAVLDRWAADWDAHLAAVRAHFADRPGKLIAFDLDREGPEDLAARLPLHDRLDPALWNALGQGQTPKSA